MSLGVSRGGLPPDALTEDEDAILRDARRVIEAFHDPARYAMVRVGVAPCSPFSVTEDMMREAGALARSYRVGLHTHLAESVNDVGLRAFDAIHLDAALTIHQQARESSVGFSSFDQALNAAAAKEGLRILRPEARSK